MTIKLSVFSRKFTQGILIYAVLFLAAAAIGLGFFWEFIESYENSRPKNTLKAFVDQLTVEQMCEGSDDLYAVIDPNIQERELFDQVIRDSVTEPISYAKKSSETTDDRQVYILRCGKTPIGKFAISAGDADRFGFRKWEVTEVSFDFSHLMGEKVSVTVPSDYCVRANGKVLDENYITESGIEYTALDGFYEEYTLPVMVTYTVERFLGEVSLTVTDQSGADIEITPQMDINSLLPVCSAEEAEAIEAFSKEFVRLWVNFSGSTGATVTQNYYSLRRILPSDGVLAQRLYTAVEGLTFGQTSGISVQNVMINRTVPLGNGIYMCDMTYDVRTIGRNGPVDTTSNMKIMIVTEASGFKVQAMERY